MHCHEDLAESAAPQQNVAPQLVHRLDGVAVAQLYARWRLYQRLLSLRLRRRARRTAAQHAARDFRRRDQRARGR